MGIKCDNRTLSEVYHDLADDERITLVNEICLKGRVATSTAYAWVNGQRVPSYLYQEMIKKTLARKFKIDIPIISLFRR